MAQFQVANKEELKRMLEERNLWPGLQSENLVAVEQDRSPAKIVDGDSLIISYYDQQGRYVCTLHRIVSRMGEVVHEHAKDAVIDGVRYRAE